jgi:hypothetical protein
VTPTGRGFPQACSGFGQPAPASSARSHHITWFVILGSALGRQNQLHDLLNIFLHRLKFPARQIELSPCSGNLGVGSDGRYVFQVYVNQFAAGFGQSVDLPAIPSRRNRALCATRSSDAADEAFSSILNGFATSLRTLVRPVDIDAGRSTCAPWSVWLLASAKAVDAVPKASRTARVAAALRERDILFSLLNSAFVR